MKLQLKNINKQSIVQQTSCLLAFSCSLPTPYPSYILGTWIFFCLVCSYGNWKNNICNIFDRSNTPNLLLLGLALLSFVSAIYAERTDLVWHSLFNAKVPTWVIPLTIIICRPKVEIKKVAQWFIAGAYFFVALSFIYVTVLFIRGDFLQAFFGNGLSNITEAFYSLMNRAYSGANVSIAIILTIYLWQKDKNISLSTKLYLGSAILFFGLFLYFNLSRCIALSLVVTLITSLLFVARHKKKIYIPIFLTIAFTSLIILTPNRLSDTIKTVYTDIKNGERTFKDPRFTIWPSVISISKNQFFSGYGENNAMPHLIEEYKKRGFDYGVGNLLGPHNQYLENYVELGWISVILLIGILLSMPICGQPERKAITIPIATFFTVLFVTESYLSRSIGTFVFSTMVALFTTAPEPEKIKNEVKHKIPQCLPIVAIVTMALSFIAFMSSTLYEIHSDEIKGGMFRHEGKNTKFTDGAYTYKMDGNSLLFLANRHAFGYKMFYITNSDKERTISIECKVTESFDGDLVKIYASTENLVECSNSIYNLKQKGQWQNLEMPIPPGKKFLFLYVGKDNCEQLSPYNGEVYFRNVQYK